MLAAHTRIRLPDLERAIAEELVRDTERYCPYTKIVRSGIESIVALTSPDGVSET